MHRHGAPRAAHARRLGGGSAANQRQNGAAPPCARRTAASARRSGNSSSCASRSLTMAKSSSSGRSEGDTTLRGHFPSVAPQGARPSERKPRGPRAARARARRRTAGSRACPRAGRGRGSTFFGALRVAVRARNNGSRLRRQRRPRQQPRQRGRHEAAVGLGGCERANGERCPPPAGARQRFRHLRDARLGLVREPSRHAHTDVHGKRDNTTRRSAGRKAAPLHVKQKWRR